MRAEDLLIEFQQNYNEADFVPMLENIKWPAGFCCLVCEGKSAYTIKTRSLPLYECRRCGHQQSLISNTIMHKSRTPIWKWLFVMYSVNKYDSGMNAIRLAELINVTYKTAWTMLHKVRMMLSQTIQKPDQSNNIEIKHELFRLQLFPTEARLARENSVAVIREKIGINRYYYRFMFISRQKQAREPLSEQEQAVLLQDLGLEKSSQIVINPRYQQGKLNHCFFPDTREPIVRLESMTLSEVANNAFTWISQTFNGPSLKYAQHYMDEYCARLNSLSESTSDAFQRVLALAFRRKWSSYATADCSV